MQMPNWNSFSTLKKVLVILTAIVSSIALGFGWLWSQDIKVVIPSSRVSYRCEAGATALDMLLTNYATKLEETSLGALVLEIDGVAQGDGKYWLYYVDDKEATIGAQAYFCQDKEQIIWELK